jgi:hypothetical protein
MGFIEAGASDFFVPRGYVHVSCCVSLSDPSGTGHLDETYPYRP